MTYTEDMQERVKSGECILITNQSYEEYVDDLRNELEDAENTLAGADGEIPEQIVRLITKDRTIVTISGKKDLEEGWEGGQ